MSWKLQALVSDRVCGSITRKMVLINMASRANDDGTGVFAAIPTIAGWCEIDARSVRRVVRDLEAEGLIRLIGSRPCKTGAVNDWEMVVTAISALPLVSDEVQKAREIRAEARARADTVSARTDGPPGHKVTPDTKSARTECPQTPDTVSAKPILEPIPQETTSPSVSPLRADAERVVRELWLLWPSKARKRHPKPEVLKAAVVALRTGAPEAIIAAGAAHVAERAARGDEFVKGLVPFLRTGLWQNWSPDGEAAPSQQIDWAKREAWFRERGEWLERWGPRPDSPDYRGAAA